MAFQSTEPTSARPARRGTNLPRVAGYNQVLVLDLIRTFPGTSRSELAERTGLTMQTLSNICQRLSAAGLIREAGRVRSGMGAPRIVYEIEPSGCYAVGVHIDPARLSFVLLDLAGEIVHSSTVPTPDSSGPSHVLDLVEESVRALLAEAAIAPGLVTCLGTATPGPIDIEQGTVIGPPLLPGWGLVHLREELERRLDLRVVVEKDSTAATIGEIWKKPREGENLAFIYLGTGTAAGIALDGQVLRGSRGTLGRVSHLGNIGHLTADPDGDPCPCGGRGCVAVTSLPSVIVARAISRGVLRDDIDTANASAVETSLVELSLLAQADDESGAAEILEEAAQGLARVCVQLANLLDLDSIVFGGPQWPAFEAICMRVVPRMVNRHYIASSIREISVRGTDVGGDVGAVGAASLAMSETVFDAPGRLYLS